MNGRKYWRMEYPASGKYKTLAIGVYPDVTLSEAWERREYALKLLVNGADPKKGALKGPGHGLFIAFVIIIPIPLVLLRALGIILRPAA